MDDEADRAAILKRRAALVGAALVGFVGVGQVTAGTGCDGEVVVEEGGSGAGGQPQPCLSAPLGGGGAGFGGAGGAPQPCLEAPLGGGGAGQDDGNGGAGGARPCLVPPP